MGRLTSAINYQGFTFGDVVLGTPSTVVDAKTKVETFSWDDSALPDGVIDAKGEIVSTADGGAVKSEIGEWEGLRDAPAPDESVKVADLPVDVKASVPVD